MANGYSGSSGSRGDIICIDGAEASSALGSVDFTLSSSEGTFSPEFKTRDYINSIYKAKASIEQRFESCKQAINNYATTAESVPMPEAPIDPDIFSK